MVAARAKISEPSFTHLYGDHFGGNADIVERHGGHRARADALSCECSVEYLFVFVWRSKIAK